MNKDTVNKDRMFYIKGTTVVAGIATIMLGYLSTKMIEFLPSTLIMLALFFFCICYCLKDDDDRKLLVYLLFGLGVGLIIFAVFFTLMETM